MKTKSSMYGPPADADPETAICMRKIFEALEDARLRLESDTSSLEYLRHTKLKKKNELAQSGMLLDPGVFEVDEAMLLRPEFVVRDAAPKVSSFGRRQDIRVHAAAPPRPA